MSKSADEFAPAISLEGLIKQIGLNGVQERAEALNGAQVMPAKNAKESWRVRAPGGVIIGYVRGGSILGVDPWETAQIYAHLHYEKGQAPTDIPETTADVLRSLSFAAALRYRASNTMITRLAAQLRFGLGRLDPAQRENLPHEIEEYVRTVFGPHGGPTTAPWYAAVIQSYVLCYTQEEMTGEAYLRRDIEEQIALRRS